MPSLFKESRPSHGPLNRINILSPQTPAKPGEPLKPCSLASAPIEVRGWSRPGFGHAIRRTSACGDLFRIDEEGGSNELVGENIIVEDDLGRAASSSTLRGTACVKWTFSELEIAEPGTYFYRVKILNDSYQLIGQINSAEVVVEAPEPAQSDAAVEATD